MAFHFDEGQVLDDKGTGKGPDGFTDKVAIGKARFRRQNIYQGSDKTDAESLFITGLGQTNGDAVGSNRPVRRNAADAWRYEVQDRTDGQHQRRNGNPTELTALTVMKF